MKNLNVIILVVLSVVLFSCSKDDEETKEFDGSIKSIENFFSPEVLTAMRNLGFTFNTGANPPIINGSYLITPMISQSSSVPNDVIGTVYADALLKFSNQLNEKLIVDYESIQGTSTQVGVNSFISGIDNKFSVFLKVNTTLDGNTSVMAIAYSGTLTTNGIENVQYVLIMLDDNGDPKNNLIENNTGRLFVDKDGISVKQ
ncbi:hypothetical protein SAMN05443549_104276 [Flavobacterium fluvii]|uniref:Uncharacterized protein n=1 Tax=Flavobacterium fluvii TaxID=468056 RepID=A0A1M5KEQ7_9FLAO|nr:hypothetical protein [Flavobacterium fluvii]SHG50969.1 hypothetical protein SAMN05443549_104276 [Flavobacterium fluvii]